MGVFAIYFSDDYSCFSVDFVNKIWSVRNFAYLCNPKTKVRGVLKNGVIAQLVEQRTENQRVAEMRLSFFVPFCPRFKAA